MRRLLFLIIAACGGLSLSFSNRPQMVMAQTQRSDTIYFLAATRGKNYNNDPTGVLSWCVSQSWHSAYRLPDGTQETWWSALDEVAQYNSAPPGQPDSWSKEVFLEQLSQRSGGSFGESGPHNVRLYEFNQLQFALQFLSRERQIQYVQRRL